MQFTLLIEYQWKMISIIYIFSFIFWTIFWSFASVILYRIYSREKWIFLWRSKCPKCGHKLSAIDLIPIVSYLIFKGRCRYCWNKISLVYPFLELIMWLWFVLITYVIVWVFSIEIYYLPIFWIIGFVLILPIMLK